MLHAMILNIDGEKIELTRIAIQALLRTIPSTKKLFTDDLKREFIMNGLLKAANIDDHDTQNAAMQALTEVPAIAY
jgi:hypothetical protein